MPDNTTCQGGRTVVEGIIKLDQFFKFLTAVLIATDFILYSYPGSLTLGLSLNSLFSTRRICSCEQRKKQLKVPLTQFFLLAILEVYIFSSIIVKKTMVFIK